MNVRILMVIMCLTTIIMAACTAQSKKSADVGDLKKATVVTVLGTPGFITYAEVLDDQGQKVWLLLPTTALQIGTKIEYVASKPIANYHSTSLNRSFGKIVPVARIKVL
jgi:hypothetical protein